MTFAETQKIVTAIKEVETWSASLTRVRAQEHTSFEKAERIQEWLDDAKQTVFELCTK